MKKTVKKYINKLTIGGRTVIKVMAIILIISFIQVDCIEWYYSPGPLLFQLPVGKEACFPPNPSTDFLFL